MRKLVVATAAAAVLTVTTVHADQTQGNPSAGANPTASATGCSANPCASTHSTPCSAVNCSPCGTIGCNPCAAMPCNPCNPCAAANPCAASGCNPCATN